MFFARLSSTAAMVVIIAHSFSTLLIAAEPALPPIPAVLEPLQAKVSNGWYSYKGGLYLNFIADQPLNEEQWKAIAGLGAKGIGAGGKGINDEAVARLATMNLEALSFNGTASAWMLPPMTSRNYARNCPALRSNGSPRRRRIASF